MKFTPGPARQDTQPAITRLRAHTCTACHQLGKTTLHRDDLGVASVCSCGHMTHHAWTDMPARLRTQFDGTESDQKEAAMAALTLPTKPRPGGGDPQTARVLLIGHPKVGKTTFASEWAPGETLILDTHNGTKLLAGEHYVQPISSYDEFTQAIKLLAKGGHAFKTVLIDTVDDIYKFADAHAAQKAGKVAAGLIDFGKGTAEAEGLFRRDVGELLATGLGVWFIGHAETEQNKDEIRYVAKLDKRVRTFITGSVDYIWFAERKGPRTVLNTQPSGRFEAGSRTTMPEQMGLDARAVYAAMAAGLNPPAEATQKTTTDEKVAA